MSSARLARVKRETTNSETDGYTRLRKVHNVACPSPRAMWACERDTDAGRLRVLRGVVLLAGLRPCDWICANEK